MLEHVGSAMTASAPRLGRSPVPTGLDLLQSVLTCSGVIAQPLRLYLEYGPVSLCRILAHLRPRTHLLSMRLTVALAILACIFIQAAAALPLAAPDRTLICSLLVL